MSSISGLFTRCRPLMASAFVNPRNGRILSSKLQFPYLTQRFSYDERSEYSQSSWMDKNRAFSSPGDVAREKQKRRRTEKRKEEFNDKTEKNFREEFRGTRVFVQNIPEHVRWQDLKDHFKIVGEVVFASVSVDSRTGMSKGCGVVQYETTEMAKKAIKSMRDHPMDGSALYVRADVQEAKAGRTLGPGRQRGPTKSSWRCADEDNLDFVSEVEQVAITSLIRARDQARFRKNYDVSDNIREDLKQKYSVHLDDRLKLWWKSVDNVVPESVSEMKGDGRWGTQKSWRQIPTTPENDACVSSDLVEGLLKQRDIARREKDFSTADRLLEEARNAPDGDLYLRIHDESRTWRIWTEERPQMPVSYERREPPVPKSAAQQCIELVTEHEPAKIGEVKNLLKKFPGREFNILKRLKQNYTS